MLLVIISNGTLAASVMRAHPHARNLAETAAPPTSPSPGQQHPHLAAGPVERGPPARSGSAVTTMPSHTSCAQDMLHHGHTSPTPSARYVVPPPLCNARSHHHHYGAPALRLTRLPPCLALLVWIASQGRRSLCRLHRPLCRSDRHASRSSPTCSPSDGLGLLPRVSNTTDRSTGRRHAPPCATLSSTSAPVEHDLRASTSSLAS